MSYPVFIVPNLMENSTGLIQVKQIKDQNQN